MPQPALAKAAPVRETANASQAHGHIRTPAKHVDLAADHDMGPSVMLLRQARHTRDADDITARRCTIRDRADLNPPFRPPH